MLPLVDILIPTRSRPSALAVTLAGLLGQTYRPFRLIVSDQTDPRPSYEMPEPLAVLRTLRATGIEVETHHHLPLRGMAEQRHFLLAQASAPYILFLDDDLLLEPDVLERMVCAMEYERCGFVGCAPIGLSYADDVRPHEQAVELWEDRVRPERIDPRCPEWRRHTFHNAANVWHVQRAMGLRGASQAAYKVAWVGGCVLFDTAKLRETGGFEFWHNLPPGHCGEDALAQLRVMARYGGCGLLPSGVYHLELPTTVRDRRVNAPEVLGV